MVVKNNWKEGSIEGALKNTQKVKSEMDENYIKKLHLKLHSLSIEQNYTFYYDETNNIRKLHINEEGINITDLKPFVLGGIVQKDNKELNVTELRKKLNIQETAEEIKTKHIIKNDFLSALKSKKLNTFLNWLVNNNIYIHYHCLDPFYWSIADIIDSIIEEKDISLIYELKSILCHILRNQKEKTFNLLKQFNYPNIEISDRNSFLNGLIEIIASCNDEHKVVKNTLSDIIHNALKNNKELVFIEGFDSGVLIENFVESYKLRAALFNNSNHIFDEEKEISKYMAKDSVNYTFLDSKNQPLIQISDVVVGLLGKMFSFICSNTLHEIIQSKTTLNDISKDNLSLINNLITLSNIENKAFLHCVISIEDYCKFNILVSNNIL